MDKLGATLAVAAHEAVRSFDRVALGPTEQEARADKAMILVCVIADATGLTPGKIIDDARTQDVEKFSARLAESVA